MKEFIIINNNNGNVVTSRLKIADTFFSRLKGLLGTKALQAGHGLLIKPCSSVHTIGMKYPIDVIFISKSWKVLKVADKLQPNSFSACWGSAMVLELPSGVAVQCGVEVGHQLLNQSSGGR